MDLTEVDPLGNTLIHIAARKGYFVAAEALMVRGLNPYKQNKHRQTSLDVAVSLDCMLEIMRDLKQQESQEPEL